MGFRPRIADDRPILIGDGEAPAGYGSIPMTAVSNLVLRVLVSESQLQIGRRATPKDHPPAV